MKKSSFVEGTVIATLAIIITKIMGMLYVIPFYAIVGIQGSALYAYAYSIYNIFLDISTAGLPIAISKIINEYNTLGKMDAKIRAYHIGKKIMVFLAIFIFVLLFLFAPQIAKVLIGDMTGGNTIRDVSFAIRSVSFAILIVPFLSVEKGFLQGHKIINVSSISQVIEQIFRIAIILLGSYLTIKVFGGSVTLAVGIAVFGAFASGVLAYAYVRYKVLKNKGELGFDTKQHDDVSNKEIIKKIFSYAIPFIIINIVSSCYSFTDMTLILRTLNYLKLDTKTIEFATGAVATWAPKINMIIASIAMGMSTSFIPTMVSAYTLKDWDEVNNKFNQAIQMLLFISIPMTLGICFLSQSIWSIFYGHNVYGGYILGLNIWTGLCINIYMITSSALQGLNKFKLVYLSTITGFATNALLDVPLMVLYSKIGIPPFLGAVTASIVGYSLSILIAFVSLKKDCKLKYRDTFNTLLKLLIPNILMVLVLIGLKFVLPLNLDSRMSCVLYVAINAIVGGIVYAIVSFKMGLVTKIIGKSSTNKLLKKISFGKLSV